MQNTVTILNTACSDIRAYYSYYYNKQPYHTLVLTGEAWVQELLASHPKYICFEHGAHKHIFKILLQLLCNASYVLCDNKSIIGLSLTPHWASVAIIFCKINKSVGRDRPSQSKFNTQIGFL